VQQELAEQLGAAIDFADLCAFLTSGRTGDQAAQLISLAETLFHATSQDLRSRRPRS
jgi:hypothetical protein